MGSDPIVYVGVLEPLDTAKLDAVKALAQHPSIVLVVTSERKVVRMCDAILALVADGSMTRLHEELLIQREIPRLFFEVKRPRIAPKQSSRTVDCSKINIPRHQVTCRAMRALASVNFPLARSYRRIVYT